MNAARAAHAAPPIAARIRALDWSAIARDLDATGAALAPRLLCPDECAALAAGYAAENRYRNRVVMARHGFGRGEYQYYAEPLPPLVQELRAAAYAPLAAIANRWNATLHRAPRYPSDHAAYRAHCHEAGQRKPTPLILRYGPGDYNCLHQDLYGAEVFPLQLAILLSEPGRDFSGGEFVLSEQRPRMQSRVEVVPLEQGDGVIFAVNERPVQGARGPCRVRMRHGVSRVRAGQRFTLGVIFHDAA